MRRPAHDLNSLCSQDVIPCRFQNPHVAGSPAWHVLRDLEDDSKVVPTPTQLRQNAGLDDGAYVEMLKSLCSAVAGLLDGIFEFDDSGEPPVALARERLKPIARAIYVLIGAPHSGAKLGRVVQERIDHVVHVAGVTLAAHAIYQYGGRFLTDLYEESLAVLVADGSPYGAVRGLYTSFLEMHTFTCFWLPSALWKETLRKDVSATQIFECTAADVGFQTGSKAGAAAEVVFWANVHHAEEFG